MLGIGSGRRFPHPGLFRGLHHGHAGGPVWLLVAVLVVVVVLTVLRRR